MDGSRTVYFPFRRELPVEIPLDGVYLVRCPDRVVALFADIGIAVEMDLEDVDDFIRDLTAAAHAAADDHVISELEKSLDGQ